VTHDQFEALSNQAVAACGVVYFLAVLAHLAQWSAARKVTESVAQPMTQPVAVGADWSPVDVPAPDAADGEPDLTERLGRVGVALTVLAAAIHLMAVVSRGLAADPVRVPWGNMYEFTLTGTWVVVMGYLLLYRRYSLSWLAPVVTSFVLITLMIDVLLLYTPVVPLRDALQSPWLVIHVVAAITATGAFTLGGMCSALFLVKQRWEDKHGASGEARNGYLARLPRLEVLDRMAYRTHAFGFPIWTFAALIAGPIWAHYAWGRYWGWDPKEVWAFISWIVYACYLHARATPSVKRTTATWIALLGFATMLMNLFGVNLFFSGLHSYANPGGM
jgi:cytochrome c-type biogenesis protein CcsB